MARTSGHGDRGVQREARGLRAPGQAWSSPERGAAYFRKVTGAEMFPTCHTLTNFNKRVFF